MGKPSASPCGETRRVTVATALHVGATCDCTSAGRVEEERRTPGAVTATPASAQTGCRTCRRRRVPAGPSGAPKASYTAALQTGRRAGLTQCFSLSTEMAAPKPPLKGLKWGKQRQNAYVPRTECPGPPCGASSRVYRAADP